MASPATGGGIRFALRYGRRAAQIAAEHLLHFGPPPEIALAKEMPRFGLTQAMRSGLDLALPNALLSAAFGTPAMRWLAQHVYFRKRGRLGVSFTDYEARLATLANEESAAAHGFIR